MSYLSGKKQWNKEEICTLIELYRQNNNLWDCKNGDYKNRHKKLDSLKEISVILNTTVGEVDRKIKNLVSQYNREIRKYKKMKKSGAGQYFLSNWFGYEAMHFLKDKNKPRKGMQGGLNLDTEISCSSSDGSLDDTQISTHNEDIDQDCSSNPPEMSSGTPKETPPEKGEHPFTAPKPVTKKSKSSSTNMREEAFEMMKSVYQTRTLKEIPTRDDFDVFGELVARKVRSLSTKYAKAKVQHLINNILFNAELGMYDDSANYVAISPSVGSSTSVSSNSQFVDPTQTLAFVTIPTTSSSSCESPNSVIDSGQTENGPLTWAIATSFGVNNESESQ